MKISYASVISLLSHVSGLHVTSSIASMIFTPLLAATGAALVFGAVVAPHPLHRL